MGRSPKSRGPREGIPERMGSIRALLLGAAAVAVTAGVCGCAGPNSAVVLYEGPDRPDDEGALGPPPPSDYRFGPTRREVDTNGDRRVDRVEFVSNGVMSGVGEDTNHDGKMDVYRKLSNGKVVEEVRDTDFDGILDVRAIDTDNDGTLDKTIQLAPPLDRRVPTPR